MRVTVLFCTFLLAALALTAPVRTLAQVRITVAFGPPALPIYEQPICPGDGYIWTPGYWAWDPDAYDYYWVPGTWVVPPHRCADRLCPSLRSHTMPRRCRSR